MMRGWLVLLLIAFCVSSASATTQLDSLPDCGFSEQLEGLRVGAVLLDFETGAGCVENLDESFHVASVPKIFVAGALYQWMNSGMASSTSQLVFTENYWMAGRTDCLNESRIGERYTNQQLIEYMINCSDNAATWMLMDSMGWGSVQSYIDTLNLEGIGRVIPYSEVDRLKLTYLDAQWADVPVGMASRFYRSGRTAGLERYFSEIPERPSREEYSQINARYFEEHSTNTATPRAITEYIMKLRDDLTSGSMTDALTAQMLFDTLLYTQRQYSVQAFPGTLYLGGKNGFDRGLLAEVNVVYDNFESRIPSGLALIFLQYEDINDRNGDLPGPFGGPLNQIMLGLSPQILNWLQPDYAEPLLEASLRLSHVSFNEQTAIQRCWNPYFLSDFAADTVPSLQNCFQSLVPLRSLPVGENLAMGLILRGLNGEDMRMVFIFTAPDGRRFSYQEDRRYLTDAAVYWYHPLDMAGNWQVDIYLNLRHVHTESVIVR